MIKAWHFLPDDDAVSDGLYLPEISGDEAIWHWRTALA